MIKNWGRYRVVILAIIIISFFITRTFFEKDDTVRIPPLSTGINRNITTLIYTTHAKCRMDCRDITKDEVKEILNTGNINYMRSNLKDERGPTYALEGYSTSKQHLRIVFAPKKNELVVVTCIDIDKEWQCDCK